LSRNPIDVKDSKTLIIGEDKFEAVKLRIKRLRKEIQLRSRFFATTITPERLTNFSSFQNELCFKIWY
jgi:phosphatidylserine/phosphatidylglycerophosphate/cardiolipin synthase-like enzyme